MFERPICAPSDADAESRVTGSGPSQICKQGDEALAVRRLGVLSCGAHVLPGVSDSDPGFTGKRPTEGMPVLRAARQRGIGPTLGVHTLGVHTLG
eukprot:289943-Chlamydomonas_euryale.AAC.1